MAKNVYNIRNSRSVTKSAYVSGSAVRKLYVAQPEPERQRRVQKTQEEKRQEALRIKKINRANRINFLYTAAVTGVVVLIFAICCQYLGLQSDVKKNAGAVSKLQTELNNITTQNDELEVEINAGIDYDSLYNTAVNELGMVYPESNQVITYDAGVSEYVKQYSNIPDAE